MVYFLFYLGTKNIMLNLPFLFPFNFLFLSFSFLLIIFSNFLCYFFATENSKQHKITYLQHVSFTFFFFPFDVSFCFFSCFLFSFSFFSLVISDLRAFLFYPRVLYSLPALIYFATTATHTIFVPFPSIWRHFSPRPVLAPVQKFNAVKSASFCRIRDRCCNLL